MPVMRTYECPGCGGRFDHLHMRSTEEPPYFCPLCGTSKRDVHPDLSAPHIRQTIGVVADNVYRQMETASQARAEMAAEMLGESVSEMSAMKMTDMKDSLREGDLSAPRVAANVAGSGIQSAAAVQGHIAAAKAAPDRGGALRMADVVKASHPSRVARAVVSGGIDRPIV